MAASILFATLTGLASGSGPSCIDLRMEVIEARSITDLDDGQVVDESELTVQSGARADHRYTDPRTGHEHRVAFELTSLEEASPATDSVAVRLWVDDLTTGEPLFQKDHLTVDGRMVLTLYPAPGAGRQVFLSLEPRVRKSAV